MNSDIFMVYAPTKPVWRWYVFGGDDDNFLLIVNPTFEVPWWRRFLTSVFFGSRWKRL